jgi:8-oxo-dGTP pyrophosphatase MutT (NUDIX family)
MIIPTVGVVVIQGERVLLIRHGDGAAHLNNTYGLPAGHIDDGETEKQAAKRELFEEAGLIVEEGDLIEIPKAWSAVIERKDGFKEFSWKVFVARAYRGEVTASAEGTPEWTDLQSLDELNLLPNVADAIFEGLKLRMKP